MTAATAAASVASSVPWVDVAVVLVLLLYAVSGLRACLIVSAFSLVGFVLGGLLALLVIPQVRDLWPQIPSREWVGALAMIGLALLLATFGQTLGGIVGRRVRTRVQSAPGRALDAVGGLAVALCMTLVVLWFVGSVARSSATQPVAKAVGESAVLQRIDDVMPSRAEDAAQSIRRILVPGGLPAVVAALGGQEAEPVGAPPEIVAPAVAAARRSVVRVDGVASQCGVRPEGSGWVQAPGVVVTNAHVVAGARSITVTPSGSGPVAADVAWIDPALDVAVLSVSGLKAPALAPGKALSAGDPAATLGHPLAGDLVISALRVRGTVQAYGWDIYGSQRTSRSLYSLRGTILPGNSGGPVVDSAGRVVGMVIARSLDDDDTGYALTLEQMKAALSAGSAAARSGAHASTGECLG